MSDATQAVARDANTQATTIDFRRLRVEIQIRDQIKTYNQYFAIRVKGCKYANAIQNDCTVEIFNIDTATRNYLLTETSPFNANKVPKTLSVYVGRVSTGEFLLYTGQIVTSKITQPPDIGLMLKCGTSHFMKGKVGSRSGGKHQKFSVIAGQVAGNLGLSLNNQTKDRTISNYYYNGNALDELKALHGAGVDAYIDDGHLVLKELSLPLNGAVVDINASNGMIGVPEVTEQGLKVKFLYNSQVKLGGGLNITSTLNPSCNGVYVIYKLNFAVSSREEEFYLLAECLKAKLASPAITPHHISDSTHFVG